MAVRGYMEVKDLRMEVKLIKHNTPFCFMGNFKTGSFSVDVEISDC